MKRIAKGAAAALLFGWAALAHATDYTAQLVLQGGLPPLRVGSPALDGPHNLNGDWTTPSMRAAGVQARDQAGLDAGGSATWDEWRSGPSMHNYGSVPTTLGEIIARVPELDYAGSGMGNVYYSSITSTAKAKPGNGSEVKVTTEWRRGFSLAAGETMSFATLCTLSVLDGLALDTVTSFTLDTAASFASLTMADVGNRVSASLFASLTSAFGGNLSDVFRYTLGDGGLFVLSITNTTADVMTGWMNAGTYVDVSAPIPEPGLAALFGMGAVAIWARRRRSFSYQER
jgi:hypothetical protein